MNRNRNLDSNLVPVNNSSTTARAREDSFSGPEYECARLLRAFYNGYRSDLPSECDSILGSATVKKLSPIISIPGKEGKRENEGGEIPEEDRELRDRFLRRVTSAVSNFGGVLRKTTTSTANIDSVSKRSSNNSDSSNSNSSSSEDSNSTNYIPTSSTSPSSIYSSHNYQQKSHNQEQTISQNTVEGSRYQRRISCSNESHPSYCESYEKYLMTGFNWD